MPQPRLLVAAFLVLGLVFATAMTRPAEATWDAETAALTTEAHALVAQMQDAARTGAPTLDTASAADHPLALIDTPGAFQALTIYRDHGAFRLTAQAPGVALLTVTDAHGTPRLHVQFDRDGILQTEVLA